MYSSDDYKKYKGHRLLAVDGTSLRLPTTPELSEKFGLIVHLNGSKQRASNQVEAKATILYDVLNEIPISAELLPGRTNDLKACQGQLEHLNKGDILIADQHMDPTVFLQILSQATEILSLDARRKPSKDITDFSNQITRKKKQ